MRILFIFWRKFSDFRGRSLIHFLFSSFCYQILTPVDSLLDSAIAALSSLALISVGVHASHHSWLNFVLGSPGFWLRFPVRRRLLRFLPTRLDSGSASSIPGLHFSSSSIGLSTGQLLVPSFGPLLRSAGRFSLSHRQVSFP
jgi:hypothetical protein